MIKSALVCALLAFCASAAQAVSVAPFPVSPHSVTGYRGTAVTTCMIAGKSASRADLCNALGTRDVGADFRMGGFLSVGLYDYVEFAFDRPVTGALTIWEVTGNTRLSYVETLDFQMINTATNAVASGSIRNVDGAVVGRHVFQVAVPGGLAGGFDVLRVTDTSDTFDGFDIDALTAEPVPLPASAALLLAGVAALGFLRPRP